MSPGLRGTHNTSALFGWEQSLDVARVKGGMELVGSEGSPEKVSGEQLGKKGNRAVEWHGGVQGHVPRWR